MMQIYPKFIRRDGFVYLLTFISPWRRVADEEADFISFLTYPPTTSKPFG